MRLVGGRSASEGRVEMCVAGMWRTACGRYFDTRDAQVVCRQLGYTDNIGN